MNIKQYMAEVGIQARTASRAMVAASSGVKDQALLAMADAMENSRENLIQANLRDMQAGRDNGLDAALLDRVALTPARINTMLEGLRQVVALPDPVGAITDLN